MLEANAEMHVALSIKFLIQVSYETWNNIFVDNDADTVFNAFLITYLRIFYSNFLKKTSSV